MILNKSRLLLKGSIAEVGQAGSDRDAAHRKIKVRFIPPSTWDFTLLMSNYIQLRGLVLNKVSPMEMSLNFIFADN